MEQVFNAKDVVLRKRGKYYIEIDGICIIINNGKIIGWYRPDGTEKSLNEWMQDVHRNAVEHGWHEKDRPFSEYAALCHSEISEALEEDRAGKPMLYVFDEFGEVETDIAKFNGRKPEGVAVEMIDCIIRILDWCGRMGVDVEQIMQLKHEYNKSRPYRHGKVY